MKMTGELIWMHSHGINEYNVIERDYFFDWNDNCHSSSGGIFEERIDISAYANFNLFHFEAGIYCRKTRSVLSLLMPWWFVLSGHQQQWY